MSARHTRIAAAAAAADPSPRTHMAPPPSPSPLVVRWASVFRRTLYPGDALPLRVIVGCWSVATLFLLLSLYVFFDPGFCVDRSAETALRTLIAAEPARLQAEAALQRSIDELQAQGTLLSMDNVTVHIFTVGNKPDDHGLDLLRLTSGAFGWDLHVMGENDVRIGIKGWATGFGLKIKYQADFIRSIPGDDFAVFVDAFDVTTWGGVDELKRGYLRACARALQRKNTPATAERMPPILFSAETGCMEGFSQPMEGSVPFPCLNSGAFIGRARDLNALLSTMTYDESGNDQADFTRAYLLSLTNASWPLVILDHEHDAFLSLWGVDPDADLVFSPMLGKWRHVATQGVPVFAHWNGAIKLIDYTVDLMMGRQHRLSAFGSQWFWCRSATLHDVRQRTAQLLAWLGVISALSASVAWAVLEVKAGRGMSVLLSLCCCCRRGGGASGGGGRWSHVSTSDPDAANTTAGGGGAVASGSHGGRYA